jgi:putative cardiolipin synthase
MVWARAEVIVDSLDRFKGGSESVFVELTRELGETLEKEIVVQTAYLIPAKEGVAQVEEMTNRGVRVRILTNSLLSNNHSTVHSHYMKRRKAMLKAGVELHELRPDPAILERLKTDIDKVADSHAGLHTKAFVADGRLSMIGSYNMDPRSRVWNSEIALLIHSEEFAEKVLAVMEEDFLPTNSYRVTLDDRGDLVWTAEGPDGTEVWHHDPGASIWKRMMVRIMSWIPMGGEL